eukprot:sb/3469280/
MERERGRERDGEREREREGWREREGERGMERERGRENIFFYIGMFVNEGCNQILKRLIADPRPARNPFCPSSCPHIRVNRFSVSAATTVQWSEYGMPSAHSQFAAFFSVFMILLFYIRIKVVTLIIPCAKIWKHLICIGFLCAAALIGYSRLYLKYHTSNQILCGFLVGGFNGALWFILLEKFVGPYFPIIASLPVCEMLLIKDYSLIPNVLWCEYHCIKQEMRSRLKKYVRPE